MGNLRTVRLSPSYTVAIPADVTEENDGRVCSFWRQGEPLLLQLSSYLRTEGEQSSAHARLQERIKRSSGNRLTLAENLHPDRAIDQATAEQLDDKRVLWVHTYLVWPHLTVYALISGPEPLVRDASNWAAKAIASLALVVH